MRTFPSAVRLALVRSRALAAVFFLLTVGSGFSQENLALVATTQEMTNAIKTLGSWVWDSETYDKQTCRFWRSFDIPAGTTASRAILHITVDNGYRLFLDGREIGRGSDWKTLTEYDVRWLLNPGRHVLGVEAFNDRLAGGLIFGLHVELVNQRVIDIVSDENWRVVPLNLEKWETHTVADPAWKHVKVEGGLGTPPWNNWPYAMVRELPLHPIILPFWQKLWFQITTLVLFGLLLLFCLWLVIQLALQSKAQRLLQLQRARIARDIHDDLGARLTQLVLMGEIAQSELPVESGTREQINRICGQARDVAHAMDEIVWAVSSRRDNLPDFAAYVCKYALAFLKDSPIRCWLDVEQDLPVAPFDLAIRRNLLLAVKEALSNAAKYSGATELFLRIHLQGGQLEVVVQDDGQGFEVSAADSGRNGLFNMAQRMAEIGGAFKVQSGPGMGCRIQFNLPLTLGRRRPRWVRWLLGGADKHSELELPPVANEPETAQS